MVRTLTFNDIHINAPYGGVFKNAVNSHASEELRFALWTVTPYHTLSPGSLTSPPHRRGCSPHSASELILVVGAMPMLISLLIPCRRCPFRIARLIPLSCCFSTYFQRFIEESAVVWQYLQTLVMYFQHICTFMLETVRLELGSILYAITKH